MNSPKEILIVDDDLTIRLLVKKILENSGMEVVEAESVRTALELASKRIPHAILTDLSMPGESGFAFLEKKRAIPELAAVPTMVLSRISEKNAVYTAMSLGAMDYILKPVRAATLVQKLRKALRDNSFPVYRPSVEAQPILEVSSTAKVVLVNEVGFKIESPFRIFQESIVRLDARIMNEMELSESAFRATRAPVRQSPAGFYVNEINAIGIGKKQVVKINEVISKWK